MARSGWEYIATLHGEPSPPPWFLLGHSDYFSGFVLKDGEYQIKPFDWRQRQAQALIREKKACPIGDLLRLSPEAFSWGRLAATRLWRTLSPDLVIHLVPPTRRK
jgi:hypothetical protein